LVALVWVDGEFGEGVAGGVFDGGDVGVVDEQDDVFVFVCRHGRAPRESTYS
jgi:hypothetical protein